MEIRVNRSDFANELAPMQGIVERKTTIPVLSHILLTGRGGRLNLAATDLDVSLTSWCDAEVSGEGGIAVQARKFMEIIRSVVGDEVTLVQEEPEWLTILAGSSRFKIQGKVPDEFPTLPEVGEGAETEIPFNELRGMISKVIFAVSAEESRFQLNGALLKLKDGSLEMVATDGHRLALVERPLTSPAGEDSVLVPRKALAELQRFEGGDVVRYRRGEHHLSFRLGRRELICRILEGTFPDYARVIARDNDKRIVFDRRRLDSAVQRVALLTGDRARAVKLHFVPDKLVISAQNPDLGDAREEIDCTYSGSEFQVGINPDYLRDFLAVVEIERVRLELKDENSQCVCHPELDSEEAGSRYLCVIMPMRV